MSRIYLVRHGQAAFGTDDYDRLTETGIAQCRQLARHWRAIGRHVDLVYCGTLRRQRESAEAFVQVATERGDAAPGVRLLAGLEEYDHRVLLDAHRGAGLAGDGAQDRRAFHRDLYAALQAWASVTRSDQDTRGAAAVEGLSGREIATARLVANVARDVTVIGGVTMANRGRNDEGRQYDVSITRRFGR